MRRRVKAVRIALDSFWMNQKTAIHWLFVALALAAGFTPPLRRISREQVERKLQALQNELHRHAD